MPDHSYQLHFHIPITKATANKATGVLLQENMQHLQKGRTSYYFGSHVKLYNLTLNKNLCKVFSLRNAVRYFPNLKNQNKSQTNTTLFTVLWQLTVVS